MLVHGDMERTEEIARVRSAIHRDLATYTGLEPGLRRHSLLIHATIRAGELAQGLADAAFETTGIDGISSERQATGRLLLMLGLVAVRSWRSGFADDLVGCQDIAWDIAGAAVELDLSENERAALAERVGRQAKRENSMDLLRVLEPCYVGFQLGLWT
ncbi:hypothetical protein GCM10007276_13340 [Agaricicola taiwanensis]|uniref:Uncharacterized protein n=1 Tax=Agaricicola taiwanensis TaxID=591372 RepID=A0A8J2YGR0_9RHOB|nr:hypothetical protein [Agaricicola taiwanensis]GGE37235.1 hypothetical protein GCM10007276_13340 [Agaricicola taiwanensis]